MFLTNVFRQPYLSEDDGVNFGGFNEEDFKPDDKPIEGEETKKEDEKPPEEEFEEITYNKEPVKIPVKDKQKYLQMGYHLEHKVQGKLTEYEKEIQRMESFAKSRGFNSFAELEEAQAKLDREEEIQRYAEQHNVSDEIASEQIRLRNELNQLKEADRIREITNIRNQQRETLKNDPLFTEIDALVQATLKQPTMANESYENVYNYIAGTPQFRSRIVAENSKKLEEERKLTEKRVIANIHDKKSRGISDNSDSVVDDEVVEMSAAEKKMSAAFGNDPNEIAKYVKKLKK